MRITGSLWRGFKGLDERFRPLQGIIVMWVLFGAMVLAIPDFHDAVRPWAVDPLEVPDIILLVLFMIDCAGQAFGWARNRITRHG